MGSDTRYSRHHHDLVTPDGVIVALRTLSERRRLAQLRIERISPLFVGYQIDADRVYFNIKSTLAQVGINGVGHDYVWDRARGVVELQVDLWALNELGQAMLEYLMVGAYIGKLFAADERRRVRDPDYLLRMFGRSDREGRPLLSLGGFEGSRDLVLEKQGGRTVAFLALKEGAICYEPGVYSFLPTLAKALLQNMPKTRQWLHLHHQWEAGHPKIVSDKELLLVRTAPLHIRTVYARVVDEFLPSGYHHMTANVLQPDTAASGDIYELYGASQQALEDMPLEFYTLEPHREHVFFSDRDQLQAALEQPEALVRAFATAPGPVDFLAAVLVVKGTQLHTLTQEDWVLRDPLKYEFPGLTYPARQALIVDKYVEHQPAYPFLQAIEEGAVTSQGVLLCRHFPTPLLKRVLLSERVRHCLKRLYFQYPSRSYGDFFSHEDRALLVDLAKFGIPVYWVDGQSHQILQYVLRADKDAGMFVPLALVETFRKATVFGVYGSNLLEGTFEGELKELLEGILALRKEVVHPLLSQHTPLALVTGGGPGAMAVGNRVAKTVGMLSCANIVDFRQRDCSVVNEQRQNPHIEAKMTYRLDRLVERQAEFYLDFPIFLPGGVGMDFEYTLEEVRRKTGATAATPVLLFGEVDYWRRKVTSRFQLNRETGTTKGSEWLSNCFYCVQTAKAGLEVYRRFFLQQLRIGKEGPIFDQGFVDTSV